MTHAWTVVHRAADPATAAALAASVAARTLREAVAARGHATVAFSGGSSPGPMFDRLRASNVPWDHITVFQVDERIAPPGHPDRNLRLLDQRLTGPVGARVVPMPVEAAEPRAGAAAYERTLGHVAGTPPIIDVVHLGLGADGHTASLVPGDPVLRVRDRDVAVTGTYQGRRRMTLTVPVLARARHVVWFVVGRDRADALATLARGGGIPAALVRPRHGTLVTDLSIAP